MTSGTFLARATGPVLLGAFAACGVIVPDSVPAFLCVPGAGSCPDGQVCAPSTHQCVPASLDGGPLPDAVAGEDGGGGPFAGCSTLACRCSSATDCASGICGDALTLPSVIYDAAGMVSFCTKPCCTSADCDGSTVCFGSAEGNRYCVLPAWLGRSSDLGTGLGGAPCGSDGDCRSGLCVGSACADVCCSTAQSASECAQGSTCRFGTFPGRAFDTRYVPLCTTGTGAANGSACTADSDCQSGLCANDRLCHDACRNSSDCDSLAQECGYAVPNLSVGAFVSACSRSPGTAAQGASCKGYQDCQSGFCDAMSMQCTDVCYADSDCKDGWRCRPEVVSLIPGARSYSVLACGS